MGLNSITLQSNDSDVISGDIVGRINWAAASDGDGPVATSIAASISAVAEETFNDSNNATSLIFSTANDSNASEKLKITSGGHLLPFADSSYDLGSDNFYFRSIYADKYYGDIDGPIVVECRNDTGSTISKGSPVYISGYYSNNGKPQIAPSNAASASTMPAIGILANELTDGSEGHVHCFGLVTQINTSSFSVGDTVYVANGGGLTNSRPTGATDLVQNIGRVLRSDASQGRILVLGPGRTNDVPNSGSFSILSIKDAFTFPTSDGSPNQILETDGSGNISWVDNAGSGSSLSVKSTGTQIGDSDIEVLDFSNDFEITETPDKEINISLKNNYINGSFDLTTTTSSFTVTDGYTVGTLNVYQNGIKLYSGEDFTATNGTSFTLTNAAVSGDVVEYWGINYASLTPGNTSFGSITATGSQTLFSTSGYTVGGLVVFVNGVKQNSSEFTATNGTSFTLTSAASSGDIVEYIAYSTTIASTNLQKTGDTMTGNLTVDADLIVKGYKETFLDNGNTGTTQTISISSSTLQSYTLTGNCTFTMPSPDAGRSFTMFLKTGAGSFTASFTGVKFPKNSAPTITTTANRMDLLSFYSDGTYWYANINQEYHV